MFNKIYSPIKSVVLSAVIALLLGLRLPFAKAQVEVDCPDNTKPEGGICVPITEQGGLAAKSTLSELALTIIQYLLTFAGIIAVGALIIGGYWYMTAAGNEEQAEKGRKTFIQAVVGIIVVVLAFTIVTVLVNFLTQDSIL